MNIWLVIIVIAVISIILAVIALKDQVNKSHLDQAKKKLFKKRVVFHRV